MIKKRIKILIHTGLMVLMSVVQVWAASGDGDGDPLKVTDDFSGRVLAIIQGPVIKLLAAVVLLVGVAGLLRGRHKVAISCGMAFLLLLFLPILLKHF
jgi:hypothetical protein